MLLVAGGELVVRGALTLAEAVRVPPVVVGLTIVAFGTSSPELAVAIGAALRGEPDFVTGNIMLTFVVVTVREMGWTGRRAA